MAINLSIPDPLLSDFETSARQANFTDEDIRAACEIKMAELLSNVRGRIIGIELKEVLTAEKEGGSMTNKPSIAHPLARSMLCLLRDGGNKTVLWAPHCLMGGAQKILEDSSLTDLVSGMKPRDTELPPISLAAIDQLNGIATAVGLLQNFKQGENDRVVRSPDLLRYIGVTHVVCFFPPGYNDRRLTSVRTNLVSGLPFMSVQKPVDTLTGMVKTTKNLADSINGSTGKR